MHRKGIQSKGIEKGQGLPIIQVCMWAHWWMVCSGAVWGGGGMVLCG